MSADPHGEHPPTSAVRFTEPDDSTDVEQTPCDPRDAEIAVLRAALERFAGFPRRMAFLWAAYPPEARWDARRLEAEALVREYERMTTPEPTKAGD